MAERLHLYRFCMLPMKKFESGKEEVFIAAMIARMTSGNRGRSPHRSGTRAEHLGYSLFPFWVRRDTTYSSGIEVSKAFGLDRSGEVFADYIYHTNSPSDLLMRSLVALHLGSLQPVVPR